MTEKFFLGVDVGSSKTLALIADQRGHCLGIGRAEGGNHQEVGYDGFAQVLQNAWWEASQMAGLTLEQIAGAGFGVGGYDFPSDRQPHLDAIAKLGLACPLELVNDGVNGLIAGTSHGVGVNVTAGSSVNCRGRGLDGREGRIVGNSLFFGEFGGGFEIAWKGLHMVNYAWIKRIPPTTLTQIYLDATGAKDELDLMEGLSADYYQILSIIAVEIIRAAREGDYAAQHVLRWAGEELGWVAVSVIRQIGMENDPVEVVQSGSVFDGGELITAPMREIVLQHAPQAQIMRLDGPPAVGPVLLAMQATSLDGYAVRSTLIQSAKVMVKE